MLGTHCTPMYNLAKEGQVLVWTRCTPFRWRNLQKSLLERITLPRDILKGKNHFFEISEEWIWVTWTHQMPQLNVAWSLKWSVRGKGPTWSAWSSWIFQAEEFKEPVLNTSQAPRMPIPDYYTTGHVNLDLFPQTFQHCPALEESPTHMLGP